MRLYLVDHLERHGIRPMDFFRDAYTWRFNRIIDFHLVQKDTDEYLTGMEPPPYVKDYVRYIQTRKE